MLGLLRVMEGARARRVGDVLREWVGWRQGGNVPPGELITGMSCVFVVCSSSLVIPLVVVFGKKKKFERYYCSVCLTHRRFERLTFGSGIQCSAN